MMTRILLAVTLAFAMLAAVADDRETYNKRAAAADMVAFRALDLNGDGRITHEEAKADLSFGPRFNDIDINRDGYITLEEMRSYIERTYGVKPSA